MAGAARPGLVCLVTIHGIGFQQAPGTTTGTGYADALHEGLRRHLGAGLGDDPVRVRDGGRGPVYVESTWPPDSQATEPGLARLGRWAADGSWRVGGTNAPLAPGAAQVAHVALVYSRAEEVGPDPVAALDTSLLGLSAIGRYATLRGLVHMAFEDVSALLRHHQHAGAEPGPGLRPRAAPPARPHRLSLLLHHRPAGEPAPPPSGLLATIHQVEDDVDAYVARNQLRERIRGFVREALLRIAFRDDVAGFIVNGHSNGTVIGFDSLAALPRAVAGRCLGLVTAGSPLRKYVEMLDWGDDARAAGSMAGPWINLWDAADPVADPLSPPSPWRRGQPLPADAPGLFVAYDPDTGERRSVPVRDLEVDNVANSQGGGLRAHNYWDNDQFCAAVAGLAGSAASAARG